MKSVLIVGGSGGIGQGVVRACAARDAFPIATYNSNRAGAEAAVRDVGRGALLRINLQEDIYILDDVPVDLNAIVHCAGLAARTKSLSSTSTSELLRLIRVHALAPLRLTSEILDRCPSVRSIVFVLSTAALSQQGGPYALSKAAALAMCRLLASELESSGITIHAVLPGWTETPMAAEAACLSGLTLEEIRAQHLDGRLLCPDEVGEACLQLAIDTPRSTPPQFLWWDRRWSRAPRHMLLSEASAIIPEE